MNGFRTRAGNPLRVGCDERCAIVLESSGELDDDEAVHVAWSLLDAVTARGTRLPEDALESLRSALRERKAPAIAMQHGRIDDDGQIKLL